MDPRIQLVVEFLDSNLHKTISLSELAQVANLSPYHLCRLFKKQIGVSPERHLKALKMVKARRLLATTLLSIKQIMTTVGYKDKSHFARDFRAAFRLTPSEYREQYSDLILLKDRLRRQHRNIG